ncbi:ACP S-malonyltransferase [Sulfidibacter corallicola]|nr:ACP S-malonyltransferase [Sulfidibacter corallicola]
MFPGQGSQKKGMGATLFDEFKALTERADRILGYSIEELCLENPDRKLNQTQFTQPAIYVVNALSHFRKIAESNRKPDFLAGHSLGEFNALLAAGCFDFETGLRLVQKRGELMSQARDGGMAAVLNATIEEIDAVFKEQGLTEIDVANYNAPSQIVISGSKDELDKARPFFLRGGMNFVPLNTSAAFHSRYMQLARNEFETYLKAFEFSAPNIPVISNVSARPYQSGDEIANLSAQVTSSVKWFESIQYLRGLGDMEFEEIGHGTVLTKILAKIIQERPEPPKRVQEEVQGTPRQKAIETGEPEPEPLTAEEKVAAWNREHPIGTKVRSSIIEDDNLETRTKAVVLFGHRAAVYLTGYKGYFDLDELDARGSKASMSTPSCSGADPSLEAVH